MTRRSLFSTLLAAPLARALSKVKPKKSRPMAHISEIAEWHTTDTKILHELWIDYSPQPARLFVSVGDGPMQEYTTPHQLPPFKVLKLEIAPWEKPNANQST